MGEDKLNKLKDFFHYDNFDAERSVTSWFISPKTLLIIRGIIVSYSWIVLITDFIVTGVPQFFTFFTELSFVGLTTYFTVTISSSFCF